MSQYHKNKQIETANKNIAKFNQYDNIEQLITQYLVNKSGKFNSIVLCKPYFLESNAHREILSYTDFLPIDVNIGERLTCIVNNITSRPCCVVCGDFCVFLGNTRSDTGYSDTCGRQSCKTLASNPKRLQTMVNTYGSKISPKSLAKVKQRVPNLHHKGNDTLFQNHGVHNPGQLPGHMDNVKRSIYQQHGVHHPSQIPHIKSKNKSDRLQFLNDYCSTSTVIDIIDPAPYKQDRYKFCCDNVVFVCNQCGEQQTINYETFKWRSRNIEYPCTTCSGIIHGSRLQHSIYQFIQTLDQTATSNDTEIIAPYELDIVSHQYKIAVEVNGLFWHSFDEPETQTQRQYHLNKTQMASNSGYRLIHVFENEWIERQQVVESRLRGLFNKNTRIYARHTKVVKLDNKTAGQLIDKWHIQGNTGASVYYGLLYNGQVVAVMSFGKSRFDNNVEWELIRYCCIINHNIIGGASKLFTHFVTYHHPKSVITYSDVRWNTGEVYTKMGFTYMYQTKPNYYYFNSRLGSVLLNRLQYQKHKLKDKLPIFDPKLTEAHNMFNNGFRRLWDCGNNKYVWNSQ